MEFKQVSAYLYNPSLLMDADIHELQKWVQHFPHIPLFRVFLAFKGLENPQETVSSKFLENAAFYVHDRRKLKKLLHNWQNLPKAESFVAETPVPEEIQADANFALEESLSEVIHTDIPEIIETALEENIEEATAETLTLEEVLAVDEIVAETPASETEIPTTHTTSEIIEEDTIAETLTLEEVLAEDHIIEEEEIPTEDANSGIAFLASNEPVQVQEVVVDLSEESISDEDDIAFLQSIGKYETAIHEKVETVVSLEAEPAGSGIFEIEEEGNSESGLAQTDISWLAPWLEDFDFPELPKRKPEPQLATIQPQKIELTETISTISEPETALKVDVKITEAVEPTVFQEIKAPEINISKNNPAAELNTTHSFEEWLKIVDTQVPVETSKPVFEMPERDILNELKSEPAKPVRKSVIPPQPENPQDIPVQEVQRLASESILVNKDMATETLAIILLKQGKPDKAIDTYQKLMLKYPEKSSYFASQIKKIQES